MKLKHVLLIVLLVLLADQGLKIYIKLNLAIGDEIPVFGSWFKLHFIENSGMAFGMKFGEQRWAKLALSLFRLAAVVWGVFFIKKNLIGKGYHNGLLVCAGLILAGALGNLIDSMVYGKIFTESGVSAMYHGVEGEASRLVAWGQGYTDMFYGKVVDMLHFPLFTFQWPSWVPVVGGNTFQFFRPIFNIADASIFTGVVTILLFQRRFLDIGEEENQEEEIVEETIEKEVIEETISPTV